MPCFGISGLTGINELAHPKTIGVFNVGPIAFGPVMLVVEIRKPTSAALKFKVLN